MRAYVSLEMLAERSSTTMPFEPFGRNSTVRPAGRAATAAAAATSATSSVASATRTFAVRRPARRSRGRSTRGIAGAGVTRAAPPARAATRCGPGPARAQTTRARTRRARARPDPAPVLGLPPRRRADEVDGARERRPLVAPFRHEPAAEWRREDGCGAKEHDRSREQQRKQQPGRDAEARRQTAGLAPEG